MERLPGCGREGRARRRGRERARETSAAGIRFLLGQIPDRSPPAGWRAPQSAQPAAHVTATERPRGREAGPEAGVCGSGAGRLKKGQVFIGAGTAEEAGPWGRRAERGGVLGSRAERARKA